MMYSDSKVAEFLGSLSEVKLGQILELVPAGVLLKISRCVESEFTRRLDVIKALGLDDSE